MRAKHVFRPKFIFGLGLLCCSPMLLAAVKPGLWEATTTMNMGGAMPQIPPAQLEKMKQMGIKIPGVEPMTTKYCLTPEMAAQDAPPTGVERQGCKITDMKKNGAKFSADVMCDGEFKGTGHIDATVNSDSSYSTKVNIKGTTARAPVPVDMSVEATGKWLSADCGAVKPIGQK